MLPARSSATSASGSGGLRPCANAVALSAAASSTCSVRASALDFMRPPPGSPPYSTSVRREIRFSPECLDAAAPDFLLQPFFLRRARGPRRPAPLRDVRRGGDQRLQACDRLGAVHLEAAVALRLDHHHAGARDAVVARAQQPLLHVPG